MGQSPQEPGMQDEPRPAPARASAAASPIEARLRAAGLPTLPRLSWLEVDLSVLAANAATLRAALPPATALAAVVKADGYGHGLLAAAHASLAGGASMLAVATLDEADELRRAGVRAPVLLLYPAPPDTLDTALDLGLDLVAVDDASLDDVIRLVERRPTAVTPVRVHLGIDTGMTRGGFAPAHAADAARRLLDAGVPRLAGTWSHLASPEDEAATGGQVAAFTRALEALAAAGIDPGIRHLNATGGLLRGGNPPWDLARVGLALYGHLPGEVPPSRPLAARLVGLRPALTLKARAASVVEVPAGACVGYGGAWTAARPSRIATLALGYADGWTRLYAPGSTARVRDAVAPLVGRVGSDAVALDVTDVPGFSTTDEVVLMAAGIDGASSVEDLARRRGSITWEVLDDFTRRLARVYLEAGEPVAVRYLDGTLVTRPGFRLRLEARDAPVT